jgi:hypothetical protein
MQGGGKNERKGRRKEGKKNMEGGRKGGRERREDFLLGIEGRKKKRGMK